MRCLVVVDASVVRSAGESEHPVSAACRNCLLAIRDICHRVVLTAPIREEWKRHMSRFSRKWRRPMAARRKPAEDIVPACVEIGTDSLTDAERRVVEKDRPLLEAALAADGVIVSRDSEFRAALARTPQGARLLDRITWIEPVHDGVQALEGL